MKVIPSIDLSAGKAVKRVRGVRGSEVVVEDPLKVANDFYELGYDSIHVVDLDAAEGVGDNEDVIREVCRLGFKWVQVGGGIRDEAKALRLLSYGVNTLVISTIFYKDPLSFEAIAKSVGRDKLVVAIDYGDDLLVRVRGWHEVVLSIYDAIRLVNDSDVSGVLLTYIEAEGRGKGVDRRLGNFVRVIKGMKGYAGGIWSLDDLKFLKDLGVNYAVIGMAMYRGSLRGVKHV